MDILNETLKISCILYQHLNMTRKDINFIINLFNDFIKNTYNPHLMNRLNESLSNFLNKEILAEITRILGNNSSPFGDFDTESKRMKIFKQLDMYQDPEVHVLKTTSKVSSKKDVLIIKPKKVSMVHLSLENSLDKLFQKKGLSEATVDYMNSLRTNKKVISNHVQGEVWEEQMQYFEEHIKGGDPNVIALPLIGFFDDIDPMNANGSKAGKHSIGNFSITCPCFPPSFASKLESILVTDLFYTKDRKEYGNEAIFARLIQDLTSIIDEPREYMLRGVKTKVHFFFDLTTGDNKGMNEIVEYIVSFFNTQCCRICYASPDQIRFMVEEDPLLLRTVEQYEIDVKKIEDGKLKQLSDYKGRCQFNKVPRHHAQNREHCDIMHDVFEGMGSSEMAKIVLALISDGHITIKDINDVLDNVDFGFESTNLPAHLNLEYLNKNQKLKMSASESLFFVRYFGVMVGHHVPRDCQVWSLYVKLREIVNILASSENTEGDLYTLEDLIPKHHALYIKLFGPLSLKPHNALHYVRLIRRNGPLMNLCGLKFESKNREIKGTLVASSSRVNILKTAATRLQLQLMHHQFTEYKSEYVTFGSEIDDDSSSIHFPMSKSKKAVKYVTINDFTYSPGTCIVTEIDDYEMEFGEIERVFHVDGEIYFKYVPHRTIGFDRHHFAFVVREILTERRMIKYDFLPSRTPCLFYQSGEKLFIASRNRL